MTESDRVLREACILAEEMYWDEFLRQYALNPKTEIPKGQYERIKKLIYSQPIRDSQNSNSIQKKITSKRIKALIAAAVIIILLAVTAFAVDPIRNFIINIYNDCTEVIFNTNSTDDYLLANYSYIPEGYFLIDNIQGKCSQSLIYRNNDSLIVIDTMKNNNSKTIIDTENSKTGEIFIADNVGYYSITDTSIILIWSTGKYNHCIVADLNDGIISFESLVKIAQSREKIRQQN